MFFLKYNSPVETCIELFFKHFFCCLNQAFHLYKISDNSFILKPKCVADILPNKVTVLPKAVSIFGTSNVLHCKFCLFIYSQLKFH